MLIDDRDLSREQIQSLSDANAVASFFAHLGYNIEQRLPQSAAALNITNTELLRQIRHIERIASQDGFLEVYLFKMQSLRVADRQALARVFRNRGGDFLLVLTANYSSLDFVLLERIAPDVPSEDGSPAMTRRQVLVRPRVLTVERQNPGPVALRVLRRFTYTEIDPLAQYDKLLSAYTVAEWSEPLFNNRALFSDYYLNQRLPDEPEWQEPRAANFRELQRLIAPARQDLASATEATTRKKLIEPVLGALGFTWIERRKPDESGDEPDYELRARDGDRPLAVCLAYVWNRYLDGVDATRDTTTPDENPGAQVITLLERGEAPYAIVTNGKTWRLYAAGAHSRATNYYEIDLEETIASPEREAAFPYFWLFFRAQAFVPQDVIHKGETRTLSFLDRVQEGSEDYALKLGESLKERVFEHIFQHFAEGFIASIRQREGQDAAIDQDRLDTIYQGTLTFLYRLMFLLYAESRALLPVQDVRGYYDISLEKLKREIAERAGNVQDEAPGRLRKAYAADSFELYERLTALFKVIDQGDADRNVPRYNGGLFITEPGDGATQEQVTARFLRDTPIPDRHLALGLDLLARDVDERTKALALIDFKSLGVRQLGSIYEGLLEFKLRIAPEKMAIVKGKRTEEIIPYAEAKKSKRRILTEGRGQNATERTLPKGAVYLENTRQERKATGSYYTPNYIVQYIVAHTVGPVLDEKFAALTPRLRDAERRYQTAVQNARAKSQLGRTEDPEKFWNSDEMLRLAYDALDIKVLDPAMGSGHFLVEAVDFITDRMLNFLNGFPRNPVRAALERTRRTILDAMEDQGVSIDRGRLNDVALLKRQVLKRCVYGVDLNPMAVELAKVSLWLDAFTLGAPLSFLDHHLRWGNSLIGAMARDADKELQSEQRGEEQRQFTLFGGPFTGLLRSAEIMRGIGMLADATMEQAQESAHLFAEFEEKARPYKQLLDVFVIRHFGVTRADEFLRLYGADVMTADPDSARLPEPYKELLRERQRLYEQYRFFHWDLEFPEVFIDLERAAWKENAGFDAVIGNPPYLAFHEGTPQERDYYRIMYTGASGKYDQYVLFIEMALKLTAPGGYEALVTPNRYLSTEYGQPLRTWITNKVNRFAVLDFGDFPVFEEVTTYASIHVAALQKHRNGQCLVQFSKYEPAAHSTKNLPLLSFKKISPDRFIQGRSLEGSEKLSAIWKKLLSSEQVTQLSQLTSGIFQGIRTGNQEVFYIPRILAEELKLEEEALRMVITNAHVQRFHIDRVSADQMRLIYPYELTDGKARRLDSGKLPNLMRYLQVHRKNLETRRNSGRSILESGLKWWELWDPCPSWKQKRIVVPDIADRNRFAIDETGDYAPLNIIYSIVLVQPNDSITYEALLAVLNSKLIEVFIQDISRAQRGGYYRYQTRHLSQIPVFCFSRPTSFPLRAELVAQARDLYARSQRDGAGDLLAFTAERLAADETDVIHDLLAFLAEQMIDLNKQKQAEVKRFLGWLEGQIGAKIDDLNGKSILQGYLGDYQKGEGELPFADLYDRLQQNRRKLRANLSDKAVEARIAREYEASLGVLRPIKARLAHTDRLIDQIVYQLYGLTDEEIAIVEGRK